VLGAGAEGSVGGSPIRTPSISATRCPNASGPAAAPAPNRAEHPTDGPDVDLRIGLDDREVRFRVDANLAFLDAVADFPRELDDAIAGPEQEAAARTLFETLAAANRVTVDGVQLDPVLDSWRVLDPDPALIALFPISGAKALCRVRVDYRYRLLSAPRRVAFVWGLFPIDPVLRGGPDGPRITIPGQLNAGGYDLPLEFTATEPEIIWHGELPEEDSLFLPVPDLLEAPAASGVGGALVALPVGALLALWALRGGRRATAGGLLVFATALACFGPGGLISLLDRRPRLPRAEEAIGIFEPLHQNIYRAFGFDQEQRVYDALARSVDGPLLEDLYRQVYRGLVMQEEGGAVSRVQAVRTLETQVEEIGLLVDGAPGFTLRARWQVDGAVFHWGHAHHRTQEYEARYALARRGDEGAWHIVGHEALAQSVVSSGGEEAALDPTAPGAPGRLRRGPDEL
jgi:hypothetical protein